MPWSLDGYKLIGRLCDSSENKYHHEAEREEGKCETRRKIWPIPFLWCKYHSNFYFEILSGLVSEIGDDLHSEL